MTLIDIFKNLNLILILILILILRPSVTSNQIASLILICG